MKVLNKYPEYKHMHTLPVKQVYTHIIMHVCKDNTQTFARQLCPRHSVNPQALEQTSFINKKLI